MKTQNKTEIHWLSFFRVSVAGLCLFNFLSLQPDFDLLFGSHAYAPVDISYLLNNKSLIPSLLKINEAINTVIAMKYDSFLLVFRFLYISSLASLLVGFHSRFSAILSLLLFILFNNSYEYYNYGFDSFINISLFYCVLFPVGDYNAIKPSKNITVNPKRFLTVLQVHVCIAYFFSGFEKLLGFNWRNGESLWKALHNINYNSGINVDFLAGTHFFLIMGWATIILEMLYPIFINVKQTRKMWLTAIIGLHLSIGIFMGLTFFAAIMIVLNISAYYLPYSKTAFELKIPKLHFGWIKNLTIIK